MYVILLKFTEKADQAEKFVQSHIAWVKQGFDDDVFLLAGSILPDTGGAIIAQGASLPEIEKRVEGDPFVSEGIVNAEVIEIEPGMADKRLAFLLEEE
ncbi:MAG: YciI family protein [Tannerella sp.]|jgi:uncharacterized protein YciI|nr:YciI family protein [Tannerella sp.]